jgi:signal transduction histidine kinase
MMAPLSLQRTRWSLPLIYTAGVLLVLSGTLAMFLGAMQPPMADFRAMTLFLGGTAAISLAAGLIVYQFGWIHLSPRLGWTLLAVCVLSNALTFLNVWWTARLMFFNEHDLMLATILLLYAGGIATALGFFISAAITDVVSQLSAGARSIANGRFGVRVEVRGRDELAQLATAFNQMAAQLGEAEQRKQELEKLRRDLIAWVGHDLRTPLASVRAMVEALADGVVQEPETAMRYLRTAKRDIGQLSALIDDLFDMAQLDAGGLKLDKRPNSLSDLLSDTLESFHGQAADKGVQLTGMAAPGVDPVLIDARQMGRVLNNLVSNALRHTPAGGQVRLHAYPSRDGIHVEVSDTGEGIRPDDMPHIFEQFYRGEKSRSRATGGAGLGLAIAKAIVEAHGGQIRAESRMGQGTRFMVVFPVGGRGGHPLVRRGM